MRAWNILKIVYFEGSYFHFLSFCTKFCMNYHLTWFFYPVILPEVAYKIVLTD